MNPITSFAALRVTRDVLDAWNLGRDAAEADLPPVDPFPWSCRECFVAWLLGYTGTPLSVGVPLPRRGTP